MPDVSGHRIVEPIGSIIFYQQIPLDKSYEHSVKYASQAAFDGMLAGYKNSPVSAQSYSRLTKGSVRVEKPLSYLQNCNYMRISDSGFLGGKVYYAFIDSVEYVNNETVDVFFTIDVLMTYWKDFTVPANFVEREHCALVDDVVGKNLVPESFELGELICHYKSGKYYLRNQGVYTVIMYTPNYDVDSGGDIDIDSGRYVYYNGAFATTSPHIPDGQLAPLVRNQFGGVVCCLPRQMHIENSLQLATDMGAVQTAINLILKTGGSIISVVQVNGEIYNDNFGSTSITTRTFNVNEQGSFKKLDGTFYSNVKNKKLLQYPFKRLICSNNNGNEAEYKWELFTTRDGDIVQAQFDYFNVMLPDVKAYIYPTYYRGLPIDYETGVTLEDFPTPCWTEDSYSRWWAQNKTNYGLSLATGALSTGLMVATGGATAGTTAGILASRGSEDLANFATANMSGNFGTASKYRESALTKFEQEKIARTSGLRSQGISLGMGAMNIARTLGQKQTAKDTPDQTHIQNYAASINWLQDRLGFTFYDIGITGEMAEIIDSYFEMFGYATHKLKVPNFVNGGRPIWDYIKMECAQINPQTGGHGINAEAQQAIEEIFNNGITLWTNLSDVGKYNLNNHGA